MVSVEDVSDAALISFEKDRCYQYRGQRVIFAARCGKHRVECAIGTDALLRLHGAASEPMHMEKHCLAAFDAHRAEIEAAARSVIEKPGFTARDEVLLSWSGEGLA